MTVRTTTKARKEYRALRARFSKPVEAGECTQADACAAFVGLERARRAFERLSECDYGLDDRSDDVMGDGISEQAWCARWLEATPRDVREALRELRSLFQFVDEDAYVKARGGKARDDDVGDEMGDDRRVRVRRVCCAYCKSWFARSHVHAHVRSKHTGAKPFVCERPGCDEMFVEKRALERHVAMVHDQKFKCAEEGCGQVFSTRQMMKKHAERSHGVASHSAFKCTHPGCNKTYKYEYSLAHHSLSHDEKGGRHFECPHEGCGQAFKAKSDMLRHQRKHFGEPVKAPRPSNMSKFLAAEIAKGPQIVHLPAHNDDNSPQITRWLMQN